MSECYCKGLRDLFLSLTYMFLCLLDYTLYAGTLFLQSYVSVYIT